MKTALPIMLLVGLLCTGLPMAAQQPILNYTLAVNPDDPSSVQIVMRLRNLPATFHLAMVKFFLTDDRYWRYVEDLQIAPGTIAREQDGLWRWMRDTATRLTPRWVAARQIESPRGFDILTPSERMLFQNKLYDGAS